MILSRISCSFAHPIPSDSILSNTPATSSSLRILSIWAMRLFNVLAVGPNAKVGLVSTSGPLIDNSMYFRIGGVSTSSLFCSTCAKVGKIKIRRVAINAKNASVFFLMRFFDPFGCVAPNLFVSVYETNRLGIG